MARLILGPRGLTLEILNKELNLVDSRKLTKDIVLTGFTFSQNIERNHVPADLNIDFAEAMQDFSLVNFCCKKLTQNTQLLKEISASLPSSFYPILMKEAIRHENRPSAGFLMSTWPSTIISMSEVVPGVVDLSRIMLHEFKRFDYRVNAATGLCLLTELFLNGQKNNALPMLRELDLSGLHFCDRFVEQLSGNITQLSRNVSKPYNVTLDCVIRSETIATTLASLLESFRDSPNSGRHLHLYRLDISELDEATSWVLLKCVDSTELVRLGIPSICSLNFCSFVLTKFSSLTALDMSLTKLHLSESEDETLPFHLIPNLKELTLRGAQNDLSAIVPTSSLKNLQFLDLTNCRPEDKIEDDLRYLVSVPLHLRELSLRRFKVLTPHLNLWRNLLRSLAPTLKMLELVNSFENDINFEYIVIYMLPLVNLRFLKLNLNELSMKTMLENVTRLAALPQLRMITLPYKCTNDGSTDADDDGVKIVRKVIDERFATEKSPPAVVKWMFGSSEWRAEIS